MGCHRTAGPSLERIYPVLSILRRLQRHGQQIRPGLSFPTHSPLSSETSAASSTSSMVRCRQP